MNKKSSQKRREYTESLSSSEAENASASKAAKPFPRDLSQIQ